MEMLAIILFVWFVLAIFSLIVATKEFQAHKEILTNALENEELEPVAIFVLKHSFSFWFIYKIFIVFMYFLLFKKNIDTKQEPTEDFKLILILTLINVKAFWYNYIIVFLLSVIPIVLALMMNKIEKIIKGIKEAFFRGIYLEPNSKIRTC